MSDETEYVTVQWGVMWVYSDDRTDELHRGPMSEGEARAFVAGWVEDNGWSGHLRVVRRSVGAWVVDDVDGRPLGE